jgi:hypothetical protein
MGQSEAKKETLENRKDFRSKVLKNKRKEAE